MNDLEALLWFNLILFSSSTYHARIVNLLIRFASFLLYYVITNFIIYINMYLKSDEAISLAAVPLLTALAQMDHVIVC